jgi:hypothetical protein
VRYAFDDKGKKESTPREHARKNVHKIKSSLELEREKKKEGD